MTKIELRKSLLTHRCRCAGKDSRILSRLMSLDEFIRADIVLTYVSLPDEVDTHKLIKSGKRIAVPKTGVHDIVFREINSFSDLEEGRFGILEPKDTCRPVQICDNMFCVVPALACNENGFRIGYGCGYYDRWLSRNNVVSAVLCYRENIIGFTPEVHDVAVNYIITEGGIFRGRQDRLI